MTTVFEVVIWSPNTSYIPFRLSLLAIRSECSRKDRPRIRENFSYYVTMKRLHFYSLMGAPTFESGFSLNFSRKIHLFEHDVEVGDAPPLMRVSYGGMTISIPRGRHAVPEAMETVERVLDQTFRAHHLGPACPYPYYYQAGTPFRPIHVVLDTPPPPPPVPTSPPSSPPPPPPLPPPPMAATRTTARTATTATTAVTSAFNKFWLRA